MGRRMGRTVEEGAGDGDVVEGVEGTGLGNKDGSFLNKRRGRRTPRSRPFGRPLRGRGILPIFANPREAGAGTAHKRQLGGAVLARLPRRRFTPPVAVERNVPRVVRDDAVGVAPVNLAVQVHVGDGQGSLFLLIAFSSHQP